MMLKYNPKERITLEDAYNMVNNFLGEYSMDQKYLFTEIPRIEKIKNLLFELIQINYLDERDNDDLEFLKKLLKII